MVMSPLKQLGSIYRAWRQAGIVGMYRTIAALGHPAPRAETSTNSLGTFTGIPNDVLFTIVKEDRWHEGHFKTLTELLFEPHWTVLDLGANIGTHSVHCARLVPQGHVYAFEPQSLTFAILQKNLLQNGCRNVTPYKFAASDVSNEVLTMGLFTYAGELVSSAMVAVSAKGGIGDKTLTARLDDLELPRVDFIKIDIQGSEVKALQGAAGLIARDRPLIFVEIEELHLKDLGTSSKALIDLILSFDYVLYRIETDYPCDHICVPRERLEAFKAGFLARYPYEVGEIDGRAVELEFASPEDQNYARITVLA